MDTQRSATFFKLLSNSFALIPGLLILLDELPLPPGFSSTFMAILVEISCCFIIAFAWINSKAVKRLGLKRFNRTSGFSFLFFLIFLFTYILLYNYSIINSPEWGKPMFIPLFADTSGLGEKSFQQFYDAYGVDDLTYLLNTDFKASLVFSKLIIYLSFILTFVSLTITFTLLWLKYEVMASKIKSTPDPVPTTPAT